MEADSTTTESISKTEHNTDLFPLTVLPGNYSYFSNIILKEGNGSKEMKLVESLQSIGLIPSEIKCPKGYPECCLKVKPARVVDRVQWFCECGTKISIRHGTFFIRLQCSLMQVLQMILAWCEDADCEIAAQSFGVKQKAATLIYDKLDELAVEEQTRTQLGGPGSVVLAEMYPDCVNTSSPDTTDQPHAHRVLMLADTNHMPTRYCLHVFKEKSALNITSLENKILVKEVQEVCAKKSAPGSMLVIGNYLPTVEGSSTLHSLLQHCDSDMQHFLCKRIWRQALPLLAASRDFCGRGSSPFVCAPSVQRYLHTSLYRLQFEDGFYRHMLMLIADKYTTSFETL